MRPTVKFLTDDLIGKIVDEATEILCTLGVELHNPDVLSMLSDHGAEIDMDRRHVVFTHEIIEKALETVPGSCGLYDAHGEQTHSLGGTNIYFTPGSGALNVLDYETNEIRKRLGGLLVDASSTKGDTWDRGKQMP